MANPLYGQNKNDNSIDELVNIAQGDFSDGSYISRYIDFVSGVVANLTETGIDITHGEGVAAIKGGDETLSEVDAAMLVAGAVNTHSGTSEAATSYYLPNAKKGTHLAMEITGSWDEAYAQTCHCNNTVGTIKPTGVVFAKQVIGVPNGATITTIETAGTYTTPTSENLAWTAAATNPQWGPGTMLHFFAVKDGVWLVKVLPVQLLTGVVGVISVS